MSDMTERTPRPSEPGTIRRARPLTTGLPVVALARPATDNPLIVTQSRRGAVVDLLVVFGAVFAIMVSKDVFLPALLFADREAEFREWIPLLVGLTGIFSALVVLVVVGRNRQPLGSLGIRGQRWLTDIGIGLLAAVGILVMLLVGSIYVQLFFPELAPALQESQENITEFLPRMSISTIILLTVVVAVYEELLFRGFLLTRLRTVAGSWWMAVMLGAVGFGLLHVYEGPVAMVVIMFLATVFSLLFIWRRSLVAPIVAHFVFNTTQLLMIQMVSEMQS